MKAILLPVMAAMFALSAAPSALAQSITDVPRGHGHSERGMQRSAEPRHSLGGETSVGAQRQERAGRYRIQDGRMKIDFRCPDGEPARDCADLLLQVLDRLQGGETSGGSGFRSDEDRSRPGDR